MADTGSNSADKPKIVAIVVTYHPDAAALARLLGELRVQANATIVVDNGSGADVADVVAAHGGEIELLALGTNLGVAAAHNRGIAAARARGAENVILFDQDSLPSPGMIDMLAAKLWSEGGVGKPVAAIGPSLVDPGLGRNAPFSPSSDAKDGPLVDVDHLISSGSLIPITALDAVGGMRDELFIDFVDTEWCLRARSKGWRCLGSRDAVMSHAFGEPVKILGRTFSARSPVRNYYLFRNSIWLWRQPWVPLAWKLKKGWKLALRFAFTAVFARPVAKHWPMMARGIAHGISGRMGPLS